MRPCSWCGKPRHLDSLRVFRPASSDGDPRAETPGGSVYICAACEPKRERFIRRLEAGRKAYSRASRRAVA